MPRPDLGKPLYEQIAEGLRNLIESGQLPSGSKLPPSRDWSHLLGVSRVTIRRAYEELLAEGYLESRAGIGTFVATALPDSFLAAVGGQPHAQTSSSAEISQRIRSVQEIAVTHVNEADSPKPFRAGLPALSKFPVALWTQLLNRSIRHAKPELLLGYADPAGYPPLRKAVSEHLATYRGIRCHWQQVIVTSGSHQALDLATRVLTDPGNKAWIEEPSRSAVRAALMSAGACVVPVRVDENGVDVADGAGRAPDATLVSVSPSHQFPLGVTMSLPRRLALLDWAQGHRAWILEDDYDCEYRYSGRPLPSLQGLDSFGQVIYVGTLSRAMFPGLRLGYLIAPERLIDVFTAAKALLDRHSSITQQIALAEFISKGHLDRHLRRMRMRYAENKAALIQALNDSDGSGLLEIGGTECGMHIVGWLPLGFDEAALQRQASATDLYLTPIARYYSVPPPRPGIVLGFTSVSMTELRNAAPTLMRIVREIAGRADRRNPTGRGTRSRPPVSA